MVGGEGLGSGEEEMLIASATGGSVRRRFEDGGRGGVDEWISVTGSATRLSSKSVSSISCLRLTDDVFGVATLLANRLGDTGKGSVAATSSPSSSPPPPSFSSISSPLFLAAAAEEPKAKRGVLVN